MIKKILIFWCVILAGILTGGGYSYTLAQQPSTPLSTASEAASDSLHKFVPGEILVYVHSDKPEDQLNTMINAHDMKIMEANSDLGIYRLKVSQSIKDARAVAESQPFVKHVTPNYILAEVESNVITLMDIERLIGRFPPIMKRQYSSNKTKIMLLNWVVDNRIYAKAAREEDFDKDPDVQHLINDTVENTLARAYQKKIMDAVSVSESELKDYYETHKKEFLSPERIKVRHIAAKTEVEAREILAMIKAGTEFETIVTEDSQGIKARNVDLGWIPRGKVGPAFDNAAFSLSAGEVSDVVKTRFGYDIIKVEDKKEPEQQSFSDARIRILTLLKQKKQQEVLDKKRKELKEKYRVAVHDAVFRGDRVHETSTFDQNDILQKLKKSIEKSREGKE